MKYFCILLFLLLFFIFSTVFADNEIDYYKILNLKNNNNSSEIKSNYKTLLKQYHPDTNHNYNNSDYFSKIKEAFSVLGNKKKRKIYDLYGHEGLKEYEKIIKQNENNNNENLFFILSNQNKIKMMPNKEIALFIPLEYIFGNNNQNKTLILEYNKKKVLLNNNQKNEITCPHCHGKGEIEEKFEIIKNKVYQEITEKCKFCNGKGKINPNKNNNVKNIKETKILVDENINLIEKGLPEGSKLSFELDGDEENNAIPGDLLLFIFTKPYFYKNNHNKTIKVERNENDLIIKNYTLSLKEYLLGFEHSFSDFLAPNNNFSISKNDLLEYKNETKMIKIKGKGLPKYESAPTTFGDLYFYIDIDFSHYNNDNNSLCEFSEEQRKWIEENL